MKPVYKILGILAMVLLVAPMGWASPKAEYSKTIKREFSIDPSGLTQFITKYGRLDVKTWDQDRVKVEVTIRVQARSEDDAQKVFDQIRIDFTSSNNLVKAETIVESNSGWNWWGSSKSDFTIDYEVFLPKTVSLDVAHKYGDVFTSDFAGRVVMDLKYGNLRMDELSNDLNLDLSYGNATIASVRDAQANIAYSNLTLAKVRDGNFTTKYSNVSIEEGNYIQSESKYDTYRIGKISKLNSRGSYGAVEIKHVDDMTSSFRYTDFKVAEISNSADLDLEYGGARLEKVLKGFSEIRLTGRYTDFKVKVEEGANYQLEASGKYAGILYPSSMNVTYEKELATYHEVTGHNGVANARSVIKVRMDYGGLKMQ
ncbi:MAG: hypothetical protein IPL49_19950 [Saprospirales bacterium]|nr:hypothetical protein [Saprospirales bacterium]MBK8493088.1 hypothetical protein [Saprospirales bacterium]